MSIKSPPNRELMPLVAVVSQYFKHIEIYTQYLSFHTPLDKKGRYLPYDELRHRIDNGLDHKMVWSLVKEARDKQMVDIMPINAPSAYRYFLTPLIQKTLSAVDRYTTTANLELMSSKIGEGTQIKYLLKDLIEDESISSSQLEGAATTTIVAKNLLKQKRKPRTEDEKMIIGNYQLMHFAWKQRYKPLSLELLLDMHRIGVENINDDKYSPGHLRKNNDVHVVDGDGEIVHTPPDYKQLKKRLGKIVEWANENHEDNDDTHYLHPLIKAITLHFCIGYEHPFKDGNGRVARALFYWYLFKNDYGAFRYIAISLLLKQAPVKYGKSYLYTETDEMDLTYFIDYQCQIILRAIEKFRNAYKQSYLDSQKFDAWLFESGLYGKLNDKQKTILGAFRSGRMTFVTIRMAEDILDCSYNTASSVLNGLVKLNLFQKTKKGREWIYSMKDKNAIVEHWDSF